MLERKHFFPLRPSLRDGWPHQNRWFFSEMLQRGGGGGGVIFNPKIYVAGFGPLNRASWAWYCYKICNMIFRKWGGGVKACLELFQKLIHFGVGSGHPSLMVMMTERRRKNAEAECLSAEVTTPLTRSRPETCRLPKRHSDTQIQIQVQLQIQIQL